MEQCLDVILRQAEEEAAGSQPRVGPLQEVRVLAALAAAGLAAAGGGGGGGSCVSGTVPLQERLAQLGVAGRDLASLAGLGAEAW